MRWLPHASSHDGVPPPAAKPLCSLPDVAFRVYSGQKLLRRWMEDRSLELEEFRAMWRPFKGFILHLFLLILVNLTCLCRLDRFMYFTHDALSDFYCNNHFSDGPVNQMLTFEEVDSVERLWSFVDYLMEAVGEDEPPAITKDNPLVGSIRFRQVRVKAGPCIVARRPEFAERYSKCYSFFDDTTADTAPFGLGQGEAWTHREDEEGDRSYGYLHSYPSGGFWVDLPRDGDAAEDIVGTLKNNSWIDQATRAVFLEHAVYNANCNEMCHVAIRFEMPPGGGVVPFINIRCAPLMQYATVMDYWILGHEILFSISTFMLTANEGLLLFRNRRDLWRFTADHYSSMWTLMNLLMLSMSWGTMWFGVHRYDESTRLLLSMQAEGLAASQRAHRFLYYSMGCTQLLAGVVFVTWLRTFQYHRVTTQVLVTLQRSRFDLIGYFAMYLVLHCAFAQAGYYLFGNQVSPFKTFSESALAILAIALGEMRSDVILSTHSGVGPVYFMLLIFIVIFVFHNMFFVILSYNYDSVREERSQLDRGLNFIAFIKNGFLNLTKPNVPPDPQEDMERRLMRCGFSPASLQTFRSFLSPAQGMKTLVLTQDPNVASVKDLREIEEFITVMEKELLQAKSELTSLVSSLSGELYGL